MRIKVSEKELLNPGHRRVYTSPSQISEEVLKPGESKLRGLKKGQRVKPRRVRAQHQAMNEAGLIVLMQAGGIGRPATYAVIIDTLLTRKYIQKESGGSLTVTERGKSVMGFLLQGHPDLFSLEFSAKMETQLDEIAASTKNYERVVQALQKQIE